MKKLILMLAVVAATFTSCDKKSNEREINPTVGQVQLDATSRTTWHYYSFAQAKVIGTGETTDDAAWAARKDWDMAICRFKVRTNSGDSGVGLGGLYSHTKIEVDKEGKETVVNIPYDFKTFTQTPALATFVKDKDVTSESMNGVINTESISTAVVAIMKGMPPVWHKAPLHIMPSADGERHYKVDFLSYKSAEDISGHVSFQFAEIEKL